MAEVRSGAERDTPARIPTVGQELRREIERLGPMVWQAIGPMIYPVGVVLEFVVSTNPGTLFGFGTWTAFGTGRVTVGIDSGDVDFDTIEETGGAKTVASAGTNASSTLTGSTAAEAAHTHTYTQVVNHTHPVNVSDPSHADHTIPILTSSISASPGNRSAQGVGDSGEEVLTVEAASTGITATTSNPSGGVATGTTAAGSSHSHGAGSLRADAQVFTGSATSVVQPSIVVYRWKRTA